MCGVHEWWRLFLELEELFLVECPYLHMLLLSRDGVHELNENFVEFLYLTHVILV
jgi:hypothetical protein